MAILSKYPGTCPDCSKRFVVGKDMIEKRDNKWRHVSCSVFLPTNAEPQNLRYTTGINLPLSIDTNPINVPFDGDAFVSALDSSDIIDIHETITFTPSKYQQDFFDALLLAVSKAAEFRNIVVEAVAGSGKTTTLIEGIKRIIAEYPDLSICIVAFNKHIADEFQRKINATFGTNHNIRAATKHSLGNGAVRKSFPKSRIDKDKLSFLMEDIWPVRKEALKDGIITNAERKINYRKRFMMRDLVAICKSVLVDYLDANAVLSTIERYGLQIDDAFVSEIIEQLPIVMEKCKEHTAHIDFDDMGWLPIVLNLTPDKYDVVMIDEAQDMSYGDMEFLFKLVEDDGNIIAVGDRFQSLYGFRGASTDAIPNMIERLQAKVLPLSVTYRCPSSHVDLAKQIVPQLEARENAPAGEVRDIDYSDLMMNVQPGDMVICRTNAPLIRPAFECIRNDVKAMIRGADIGDSLINLIKRFETDDLSKFEVDLRQYFEIEHQKLLDKGKDMQAMLLEDRVETLAYICNECSTVSELVDRIDALFSDTNKGVVFSSVHRAKGLEANNVFILRPDLMPHPTAKQDWEKQQELNGKYVAQTRSKSNLIFVHGGER